MALAEHQAYSPLQPDGTQEFHAPSWRIVETLPERMLIIDTDQGAELVQRVDDLKALVEAYKKGLLKEIY